MRTTIVNIGVTVKPKDREILRRLAGDKMELARDPVQDERRAGWRKINGLHDHRPMLWITEIPWGEIEDKVDELRCQCEDEQCRGLERRLRHELFTGRRLKTDHVVEDAFIVNKAIGGAGYGLKVAEDVIEQGKSSILSHHYNPVIKEPEDVAKITMPEVSCDEDATAERVAFYDGIFGDILEVVAVGPRQSFFNAWDQLVRWTGVTEALMDLMVRPDFIHAIMRRMTESMLSRMTQLEENGLLSAPYPLPRVGSGASGYTDELPREDAEEGRYRLIDQWGGATAQIFGDVSPAMHDEFALAYEIQIMERCGLNYYGCCAPLHNKMHLMAKVPRLRKISIGPWCDVAQARENAAGKYVFSHKPSPAILAGDTFSPERAEADLRERIAQSGEMPCEFIMKDISTIRSDPERLIAWCDIAWRVVNA